MRVSQGSVLQFPFDSYQKHAPLSATFSYSDPETGELVVTYLNFVLKVCFCMGFSVSSVWACMLNLYFTIWKFLWCVALFKWYVFIVDCVAILRTFFPNSQIDTSNAGVFQHSNTVTPYKVNTWTMPDQQVSFASFLMFTVFIFFFLIINYPHDKNILSQQPVLTSTFSRPVSTNVVSHVRSGCYVVRLNRIGLKFISC